eukprot:CAMPEP_0206057206 /NCGR_PEP_ID=MMETSP1466-20131121/43897_1 /ASSEMBLY_ACC=CAM_ASM_001126 /TAXON_ID=44452 /ORGANISM="Pavlova gyrans, Strain CCMP608" /LENGTH=927 /DNA_ID=CAMNT_0053432475 /DNA_START=81 /DNA_END=2864 /DNA_ORIENTATION=+
MPEQEAEKKADPQKAETTKGGKKKKQDDADDLSPEDLQLKRDLDMMAERALDKDPGVQKAALDSMVNEIRTSTSSMTSVPKPLKFLRPHFGTLKTAFEGSSDATNKKLLADILSVLAMTMGAEGERESLKFKLHGHVDDIGTWGHEYVRNLSGEIAAEYEEVTAGDKSVANADKGSIADIVNLIRQMVPFFMKHNSEPEAIDLLMEVDLLPEIINHVDEGNCVRICLYLEQVSRYVPEPDDRSVLDTAIAILRKVGKTTEAVRIALIAGDTDLAVQIIDTCEDEVVRKQAAFLLSRQQVRPELKDESLGDIAAGTHLSENYLNLARELDVVEPKLPDDIYKTYLERKGASSNFDSARQNLASTFVNAFVNAGFGADKLMLTEGNKWLYKNKEHGMISAAASLGALLLWDVDGGLTQIDKFLYSTDNYIKAGALMAVGILNTGVRNECDPALALLTEYLDSTNSMMKISAIFGLGLAYVGSQRDDVLELLLPVVADTDAPLDVACFAGLALGLVFVGSCHDDICQSIMGALMERPQASLEAESLSRLLCVGVGLLYLNKQSAVDVTLELSLTLPGRLGEYCQRTLETCAYMGTGNVLKVQKFMGLAGEHPEAEAGADADAAAPAAAGAAGAAAGGSGAGASGAASGAAAGAAAGAAKAEDKLFDAQSVATIGVALVAMGEDLGSQMAHRTFGHMLQYGEPSVRQGVPLAIALLNVSNPQQAAVDLLSKLSHDPDVATATNSIFAMGLCGAGTNNSRIANNLRALASYYSKDAGLLFTVRIAQGLLHAGKGLLGFSAFHSNRALLCPSAAAALVAMMHICLDFKGLILGKHHYLLYTLVAAAAPRMLITVDEELKPLPVPVRVGTAVDIVGLAGKPKAITGFQTHTTPVLLGTEDRAELATDEYLAVHSVLEGFVILKKNPEYVPPQTE